MTQDELLTEFSKNDIFNKALTKARDAYKEAHGDSLGELITVKEQIVSGVNYKMVFNSSSGKVMVTVYCQSWTNTYEIT